MIPYNNVASDYLEQRYFKDDIIRANAAMSIPDSAAVLMVPLLGIYVDRRGGRLLLILLGAISFILGHFFLGQKTFGATVPLLILGFAYSTMLNFWACVPWLVGSCGHSTAYGILTASCNFAVTIIPLVVAPIIAYDPSYRLCGYFFAIVGIFALFGSMLLFFLDHLYHLGLNQRHTQDVNRAAPSPMMMAMAEIQQCSAEASHDSDIESAGLTSPYENEEEGTNHIMSYSSLRKTDSFHFASTTTENATRRLIYRV